MLDRVRCFVIMPYSDASDRVFNEAIDPALKDLAQPQIIVLRADLLEPQVPTVKAHVESTIASADFCIADLTGLNPNVVFELGYASALSKPLILIRELSSVSTPLGLQEYPVLDFQETDLTLLRHRLLDAARNLISRELAVRQCEEARRICADVYSVQCYRERKCALLEGHFRQAQDRVDILTTNLSFMFETANARNKPNATYFDALESALARKNSRLKVRVLTLDPESDFVARRGIQLGIAPGAFRHSLRQALRSTAELARKWAVGRFEVLSYDDFPTQITFRIDDVVFYCVVAQLRQSRHQLTFRLDRHQVGVESSFLNHFQCVWERARRV